jgi:transketolase
MSKEMHDYANELRLKLFTTIHNAGGGHFGGTLSMMEILAVLYGKVLNVNPENPEWDERDRLVLAKGHAGPALYVILADRGFFPNEWLDTLDKGGGHLPKHVDRLKVPGIDYSSGPLGQGLSVGAGMAMGAKMRGRKSKVYVLLGDGELDEGQNWEAAMAAVKYGMDNLIAIVDRNNCQIDGRTDDVLPLGELDGKWRAFGWNVMHIDGHDTDSIEAALSLARDHTGVPTVIIADTYKGFGVSFMQDDYQWHSGSIDEERYAQGVKDLERLIADESR